MILIHFINSMQQGTEKHSANQVIVLNPVQKTACEILISIYLYELGDIYVKKPKTQRMSWHARLVS